MDDNHATNTEKLYIPLNLQKVALLRRNMNEFYKSYYHNFTL